MPLTTSIRFKTYYLFAILMASALFVGCAGSQKEPLPITPVARNENIRHFNQKLLAAATLNTDPADYVLGAGDLLEIKVFETDDLSTTVRVSSRGFVTLPLLGQVEVKGLSAEETEQKIENLYQAKYLKDPHISVFVKEHVSQRVTLAGEFKNPGTYDYISKGRLLSVMAMGGGLTPNAGKIVQVRRAATDKDKAQLMIIDLNQLIKEGRNDLNIEIKGCDVIYVPEAGQVFVEGAVKRPGAYPITGQMGIRGAIAAAGGPLSFAKMDDILLFRHLEDGTRKVINVNLENNLNETMGLKDGDVILAKSSAWGKFWHGGRINVGLPFLGFGYADPENRYW
jgi:polysaccharide export outer membrane protein